MGWTAGVRVSVVQDSSFLHYAQAVSGAHQATYPIGTGIKAQEREADHLPPSNAKVKKDGAIPPLPHMSSCHSA
jgi:hypothetical protein